jgi:hypothetical protein
MNTYLIKLCTTLLLLFFSAMPLFAQDHHVDQAVTSAAWFNITGKVVNQDNNKPIPNVSVFINNATNGGQTDDNGNFNLKDVKPGKYTLIVSCIGFETYSQNIIVLNAGLVLPTISLAVKSIGLAQVTVKINSASQYPEWYYSFFNKEFLGTSGMAVETKIINPEQLDFKYDDSEKLFTASSEDYLKIKNDALGYDLKYMLTDFKCDNNDDPTLKNIHYEGSVFFTEMKGTPWQQKNWQQNRLDVYSGSKMHFFRSLLNNRLNEEGFKAYRLVTYANTNRPAEDIITAKIKKFDLAFHDQKNQSNADSLSYWKHKLKLPKILQSLFPATRRDLLSVSDQPGLYRFDGHNAPVVVIYNSDHRFPDLNQLNDLANLNYLINRPNNTEFSYIEFSEPFVLIDNNGGVVNPNSIVLRGAWVNTRVADLLPLNYDAPQTNTDELPSTDTIMQPRLTKLTDFAALHPVEKVYLHIDKTFYMPGDTLWFSAYVVNGALHKLSALSGVLHCELINSGGIIIDQHLLKLNNGLATGDYSLSPALVPGIYHVRAYTSWMRNNDAGYFFDQPITIGAESMHTLSSPITKTQNIHAIPVNSQPDVQFFTEGGNLVVGVQSKIAFKAINSNGLGEAVHGVIVDNENKQVSTVATTHLGMGIFSLTPLPGKTYKAVIICADSSKISLPLPNANSKGFALRIVQKDSVFVNIEVNKSFLKQMEHTAFYLVAQSDGKIYYTTKAMLEHTSYTAIIPKSRFPEGIVQFTLFSENGEPMNERNVFIHNNEGLINISLVSEVKKYKPHDKVKFDLSSQTADDLPSQKIFSVSVINTSRVPVNENAESTILNNLLLTSGIKGYIEQPNYYFNEINPKTSADLDMLLLTQGYGHYDWQTVLSSRPQPVLWQAEKSISISGTLKTPGGKPVAGGSINLLSPKYNFLTDTVSAANGQFKFTDVNLPDSAIVVLKGMTQKNGDKVNIHLDEDYPAVKKYNNYKDSTVLTADRQRTYYMADHRIKMEQESLVYGKMLQEVDVKATSQIKKIVPVYSSNLNGPGNADQVIMGTELEGCIKLSDCLNGKIMNVHFGLNGDVYNNRYWTRLNLTEPSLAVIVDGCVMTAPDHNLDNFINPSDIYSIEILRTGKYDALYGTNAFAGAIIITTKRGGEIAKKINDVASGLITYRFNGYYKAHSFYTPKYDVLQPGTKLQDLRPTIYWNPGIITDKHGKTTFEYFNADTKGTYRVVVEGIDTNGNLGRAEYNYQVE